MPNLSPLSLTVIHVYPPVRMAMSLAQDFTQLGACLLTSFGLAAGFAIRIVGGLGVRGMEDFI